MDTFETIAARRSVKKYDPRHEMTPDEINRLMETVLLTPTSFNIQNWRFVLITDQEVKRRVREKGYDQAQFTDSSMTVVICGDRNAYDQEPERYWADAPAEAREAVVPMIRGVYGSSEDLRRDENFRSGGLAGQTLMLAAKAMGYDTCPMVGFDFEAVAEIINLPADHDIIMAVTVGKALEPARARSGQLPLDDVVFRDGFR
ncbi:MAG: nitroreductase family protein [Candidatus Krumholzibacteriota bacterium]